jgi:bifunctional DNA-binding transcriptional regulator/antitoxin component of YhaV-PrlF toxin-antitoxin module
VITVGEFVVRVFTRGKITVPSQLRELFSVKDGDYVRLVLIEVLKKGKDGEWVKKRVP